MELPPGPKQPAAIQTIGWLARPISFLERNRARYGNRFTIRLIAAPPFVMISDPAEIKQIFTAPPEVESWPRSEPIRLHPRLQALTLEVILRAVFGLDPGPRLDGLRGRLTEILALGSGPSGMMPFLQIELGRLTPWAKFVRLRGEADELIYELIEERRRAADAGRDGRADVLSMLLEARHEDGSPMSPL